VTSLVIISDTHNGPLPKLVASHIEKADMMLHAGDFTGMEYYEQLISFGKPLHGVLGNMDRGALETALPLKKVICVEEVRIAMVHGWGGPSGLEKRVLKAFENVDWDVLVFGHSHSPLIKREEERLILNPGSPTDKRFALHNSFITMTVHGRDVNAEIVAI